MNIGQWLKHGTTVLKSADVESARLDCLLMLERVSKKDKNWLLTHQEKVLTSEAHELLEKLLARRAKRIPLAYLLGKKEFFGFDFFVNKNVLIPRPETEELIQLVIDKAPQDSDLLDIGTGSGCIALACELKRPDLSVTATDISKDALKVASRNRDKYSALVRLIESDLFESVNGKFNVITANLPYVPKDYELEPELDYEPELALFAEEDGLEIYRMFFAQVNSHLKPHGFVIVEHHPEQYEDLVKLSDLRPLKLSRFHTIFRA